MLLDTTITAVSSTAPAPFTVVSDREGYYRLRELPPGEYELAAERSGFARFVRADIAVRAGLNLAVDIDMVLGSQTETIAVKADTPMLESSSAVQAINIDGEFQRGLPLTNRRDWADSLGLAPGVISTQNPAGKVFYYLHGADFRSLVMQVDGADLARRGRTRMPTSTWYRSHSRCSDQDGQRGRVNADWGGCGHQCGHPIGHEPSQRRCRRCVPGRRLERQQCTGRNDKWVSESSSPMHRWEDRSVRIACGSSSRIATRTTRSASVGLQRQPMHVRSLAKAERDNGDRRATTIGTRSGERAG